MFGRYSSVINFDSFNCHSNLNTQSPNLIFELERFGGCSQLPYQVTQGARLAAALVLTVHDQQVSVLHEVFQPLGHINV